MEQIEKSSLGLLICSVLIACLALSAYGFEKYLEAPSLFIEPESSKSRAMLNMVLEAENIEGLQKICSLWASQEDRARRALDALGEKIDEVRRDGFVFTLLISLIFVLGAGHMYLQIRKYKKASQNAL